MTTPRPLNHRDGLHRSRAWAWLLAAGLWAASGSPVRAESADVDCQYRCQLGLAECQKDCVNLRDGTRRRVCQDTCAASQQRCAAACPRPIQP